MPKNLFGEFQIDPQPLWKTLSQLHPSHGNPHTPTQLFSETRKSLHQDAMKVNSILASQNSEQRPSNPSEVNPHRRQPCPFVFCLVALWCLWWLPARISAICIDSPTTDHTEPLGHMATIHQRTQICEFAEKKIGFFPYPVETIHVNTRIL